MKKSFWISQHGYRQKGSALVAVLLVLMVVSLLGMTLLTVTASNFKMTRIDSEYQSVYYIAEAGINDAVYKVSDQVEILSKQILTHDDFFNSLSTYINEHIDAAVLANFEAHFAQLPSAIINIDDGFLVNEEDNPQYNERTIRYAINSTGQIGDRSRSVSSSINISHRIDKSGGPHPSFDYLLYQGGNQILSIPNAAIVDGDVYGYKVIGDSSNSTINGSIISLTDVDLAHGTTINGNVYAHGFFNTNGDVLLRPSNGKVSGDIHAKGSVTVSSGCTANGSVFAGKNVSLLNTQNSSQGIQGDIHAGGNITRQSYPNTSTYIGGSSYAGGSINQHISTNTNMNIPPRVEPSFRIEEPVQPPSLSSFEHGEDDVYLLPNWKQSSPQAVSPGYYNNLVLDWSNTVRLSAGNYYFNNFNTTNPSGLTLQLDLSSGPINVYVNGNIKFSGSVQVSENGSTWTPIHKLNHETAVRLAGKVYWETHSEFELTSASGGKDNRQWFGSVLSQGNITAASEARMIGVYTTISGLVNVLSTNAMVTYAPPTESAAGMSGNGDEDENQKGKNSHPLESRVTVSSSIREK